MGKSKQPKHNGNHLAVRRDDTSGRSSAADTANQTPSQRRDSQIAARQQAQRRGPVLSRRPPRVPGR